MANRKFEYKFITVSRTHMKRDQFMIELQDKFNELGKEGWELISSEGINEGSILWKVGETVEIVFTFKREL